CDCRRAVAAYNPPTHTTSACQGVTFVVPKSVLQRCAVVSGLLSRQEIDEALQLLRTGAGAAAVIDDEQLGTYLVDSGRLNRWQVEQLKAGRTKFNLGRYQV